MVLCVLSAHLLSQTQSEAGSIYSLLQARNFVAADSAARKFLERSPGNCPVRTMLALALRGEDQPQAAYRSFLETTKLCPQSVPALEGAAELAYSESFPEAEDLLTRLIRLRPAQETAHAMLGAIEARAGNCAASVEQYAQSPTKVGRSSAALRQYGGCLLVLGRATEASDALAQLLSLQDNGPNRKALASAQMQQGKRSEALATLRPLLAPGSSDDAALLLAAQIAEADNNTPQAIAWLRSAIQTNPARIENYLYFAEVSMNHGSYQVGVQFLDLGLRERPGTARLYLARGVLKVQMSSFGDALADFEEAHRLDPSLSFAEAAMGVLFSQKHDLTAALAHFEASAREHPDDPLLQYLLAEALSEVESTDDDKVVRAIAAARKALTLEPSYQAARDLLCVLLLRHGDPRGVVDTAAEATRRDPYDEVALYQALLAERRLKHKDETDDLVRRLQEAKSHNQIAVTKYMLADSNSAATK